MHINLSWITCDDPQIKRPPMGAKRMPMMKSVGNTVFGVRIGCHAFRRCCLNAVSIFIIQHQSPSSPAVVCATHLLVASSQPSSSDPHSHLNLNSV